MPGHLNNGQLLQRLWGERETAAAAPLPVFPLSNQLVVLAVRDLGRLCREQPDAVRLRWEAQEQRGELRLAELHASWASSLPLPLPSPPAHPGCLSSAHPAFELLLLRLLTRLCGFPPSALSRPQLQRVLAAAPAIAAQSLQLDTGSRHLLLDEPYRLQPDDEQPADPAASASPPPLSASVSSSLAAFSAAASRSWFAQRADPLAHLRFSLPLSQLQGAGRQPCPSCGHSVSLYCPEHLQAALPAEIRLPAVRLPLEFVIVHHRQESLHKSTAVQACVLCPAQCRLLTLPPAPCPLPPDEAQLLQLLDPLTTLVLFPSPRSVPLSDCSLRALLPSVRRVVVIESTWQKAAAVFHDPRLRLHRLPAVQLQQYESSYWRYQEKGRHCLSTLEAMHALCTELIAAQPQPDSGQQDGREGQRPRQRQQQQQEVDDLLYLYAFRHQRVHARYRNCSAVAAGAGDGEAAQAEAELVQLSSPSRRVKPPPRAWQPRAV